MKNEVIRYRRTFATLFIMGISVTILSRCSNGNQTKKDAVVSYEQFAGSDKCAGCHKEIYEKHLKTAHYLTSDIATEKSVSGSFKEGLNSFAFNGDHQVKMESRDSGLFQVEYMEGVEKKARKFDIAVGSGTKGQTYLYWWKDTLFQLPITYFTPVHNWTNSPGYPNRVMFGRPVTSRCLECHATYAKTTSSPDAKVDEFDRAKTIFRVGCEKCHGPAMEHVQYQTAHPEDKKAKYIINPAHFTRQQNLDLCALCHGGRLTKTKPSFSFQAGDKLEDYFEPAPDNSAADIDVHGNQYGLLKASKCFSLSQMTCSSCHNVHENQQKQLSVFSQKCMNCHNENHGKECKMKASIGPNITQNCIDCHMPVQSSGAIQVLLQGDNVPTPASMRSHYIKVYPEETKRYLDSLKKHQ